MYTQKLDFEGKVEFEKYEIDSIWQKLNQIHAI